MTPEYPKLTEEEVRRNRWGSIILFVTDEHALYPFFETLYGKKTIREVRSLETLTDPQLIFLVCLLARSCRQTTERRYQRQRSP